MTTQQMAASRPPRLDGSLIAALIGNFLIRLDGGVVGLLLTLYLADIDKRGLVEVSPITLGVLASAFYVVELAFSPLMGAKSDQYGNRTLLLVGPIFGMAAVLVAAVVALGTSFGMDASLSVAGLSVVLLVLGLTRVLQGFAAAASIPSILSYLSIKTEGSLALRGRVMSIFEVTTAVGLLVGPVLGAQFWRLFGAWGFIVTGVMFLGSAAFFWVVREDQGVRYERRETAAPSEPFLPRLLRVLRRRDLLTFAPAWLAINAVVGLWGVQFVFQLRNGSLGDRQFLTDRFDENVISAVLLGFGLLFCAGVIFWGFMLGRLREVTVMRISSIGLFVLCASAFGINRLGADPVIRWPLLVVVGGALLMQSGFAPAAVTYLARLSGRSEQDRGLLMGIYSVVLGLGQFVGNLLGGPFAQQGGVDGIILLTLLLGVVAVATIFQLSHMADSVAPTPEEADLRLHV